MVEPQKTIDVHGHFLPPVYLEALRDAGLKLLDGGVPVPSWSPDRALAIMDEIGVTGAVLSVSSPHLNFVDQKGAIGLSRAINDYAAELTRRHPDRFGAYAILPLPDMAASLIYSGALARHQRINFILPHGGGTLPFLAPRIAGIGSAPFLRDRAVPYPDAMQLLSEFYYDTALSVSPAQMNALRELAPISRVLYGTDFPFANEVRLRMAEDAFSAMSLSETEQEMVRHRNAAPLFPSFHDHCCGADHARN